MTLERILVVTTVVNGREGRDTYYYAVFRLSSYCPQQWLKEIIEYC